MTTVQELSHTDAGRKQMAALAVKGEQMGLYSEVGNFTAACEAVAKALKESIDTTVQYGKTGDEGDALMMRLAAKGVEFRRAWQQHAYDELQSAVNANAQTVDKGEE